MRKILAAGIIGLLLSACHPHPSPLSEKTSPAPPPNQSGCLPAPAGLEKSSPQEISSSPGKALPSSSSPSAENQWSGGLDLPISDESNDDFILEVFPKGEQKQGPDFDIPIVINAQVEQFIQYFQTTGRKVFVPGG